MVPMLTPQDRQLLDFEATHEGNHPAKPSLIRLRFGIDEARYYQKVIRLMGEPEVVAEYTMMVHRFRRRMERLQGVRRARLG